MMRLPYFFMREHFGLANQPNLFDYTVYDAEGCRVVALSFLALLVKS